MGLTVLVVGAGKVGEYHIKALDELVQEGMDISRVFASRTTQEPAKTTAKKLSRPSFRVIPTSINSTDTLFTMMEDIKPDLTIISAIDKRVGDHIHPVYSYLALNYGHVLCEKPFSPANGDGKSLLINRQPGSMEFIAYFDKQEHKFGLHLPMAVLRDKIFQNEEFREAFQSAKRIDFYWGSEGNTESVVNDLALHPWSLIPDRYRIISVIPPKDGKSVTIDCQLYDTVDENTVPCRFILAYGKKNGNNGY